jgi:hypothetical protein
MDIIRLPIGPPCTRDQRPAASLDTVRNEQRNSEKQGHIYGTGSSTKGTYETRRTSCNVQGTPVTGRSPHRTVRTMIIPLSLCSNQSGRPLQWPVDPQGFGWSPVYNNTLGAGFGHRFNRIGNAELTLAKAA